MLEVCLQALARPQSGLWVGLRQQHLVELAHLLELRFGQRLGV
jgi:hypothetical protein